MTCKCGGQWCWLCREEYRVGHYSEGRCRGEQFGKYNCISEKLGEAHRLVIAQSTPASVRQLEIQHRREWHTWCANNPRPRNRGRRDPLVQAEGDAILARHAHELATISGKINEIDAQVAEYVAQIRSELDAAFEQLKARHRK